MGTATGLLTASPRNWRARSAVNTQIARELSRHSDAKQLVQAFNQQMHELFPTSRQLSLSNTQLISPNYRVTHFNLWSSDSHKNSDRDTIYTGGLFADILYGGEPRLIDELHLTPTDPAHKFINGQQSLLSVPIYEDGSATSTYMLVGEERQAFPRELVPEIVWMMNLFARSLQLSQLSEQLRESYQQANSEQEVIGQLQQSLLPAELPTMTGLRVAASIRTALRAGGDYYDFFPLSAGRLGVLIADVSGHGSSAAVLMTMTRAAAHAYPQEPTEPGAFLDYLNSRLANPSVTATGHFVTAFYAVFSPMQNCMIYANAGHLVPRVCRSGQSIWEGLPSHQCLPLGIDQTETSYPVLDQQFSHGDKIALFTDGLTEATNRTGLPYGVRGFDRASHAPAPDAGGVVDRVLAGLERFTDGRPVLDDRTLVVVERT